MEENIEVVDYDIYKLLYSICEKKRAKYTRNGFREGYFRIGTDFWIFGKYDYLVPEECERAVKELESGECELSERRAVSLYKISIIRS